VFLIMHVSVCVFVYLLHSECAVSVPGGLWGARCLCGNANAHTRVCVLMHTRVCECMLKRLAVCLRDASVVWSLGICLCVLIAQDAATPSRLTCICVCVLMHTRVCVCMLKRLAVCFTHRMPPRQVG